VVSHLLSKVFGFHWRLRSLPNKFDNAFDEMSAVRNFLMHFDPSGEAAMSSGRSSGICMALKREACPSCREIDWDMRIREGKCHRCRRDKDIRSFSNENLTNPGRCLIQLFCSVD
jgi:hypothetical protein